MLKNQTSSSTHIISVCAHNLQDKWKWQPLPRYQWVSVMSIGTIAFRPHHSLEAVLIWEWKSVNGGWATIWYLNGITKPLKTKVMTRQTDGRLSYWTCFPWFLSADSIYLWARMTLFSSVASSNKAKSRIVNRQSKRCMLLKILRIAQPVLVIILHAKALYFAV